MLIRLNTGKYKSVTTLLLCGLLVSMPVTAQRFFKDGGRAFHKPGIYLARGQVESLDSAVSRIRGRTGGRILSAETRRKNGKVVHHIRVLTRKGKVKRMKVVAKPISPRR